jgi:glutamine synthetase
METFCDDPTARNSNRAPPYGKGVFNGNNYAKVNQKKLTAAGLWRIDSGVEAIHHLVTEKNMALFNKMNVFSKQECHSREVVLHDHYSGTVEMEALCLVDMINQHIIPAVKEAGVGPLAELQSDVQTLRGAIAGLHDAKTSYEKAKLARVLRLETMLDIRKHCDSAEAVVPNSLWTLASYKELLFLDSHSGRDYEDVYEE